MSLNPVIAAFLQAREQAQNNFRQIQQADQFQQRLAFEQKSQEEENALRNAQLQQQIDQQTAQLKINQQKADTDKSAKRLLGFKLSSEMMKNNTFDPAVMLPILKSLGFEDDDIEQSIAAAKTYTTQRAEKTTADVADIEAKADPLANASALKARLTAEALLPTQMTLLQEKGRLAKEAYEAKATEDYKRAVKVAEIRAQATIDAVNKRIAAGMYRDKSGVRSKDKKLTASETQKFVDLQTAEDLYKELETILNDPQKKKYFVGPVGAKIRGIKKATQGLDPIEADVESAIGRAIAVIGHPLFGASFTRGEKDILTSFVPDESGNLKPDAALAKIRNGLKFTQQQRKILESVHGDASPETKEPENNTDKIKNLVKRYKSEK